MNQERWGYDMLGDRDVHPKMGVELWDANHQPNKDEGQETNTNADKHEDIIGDMYLYIQYVHKQYDTAYIYLKMD